VAVCGIDEAGRGPLAGPVYAAAVLLPDDFSCALLADSKKLSAKKREEAAAFIRASGVPFGIGSATHQEIDDINILRASLLAMRRAFDALRAAEPAADGDIGEVVVDGCFTPELPPVFRARALVKADALVPAVMAASILAKTARDSEMLRLAALYPQYCFEKHKGYPTALHRELLRRHGPSPIHRLSFRLL
jgi:ribonuclease HII